MKNLKELFESYGFSVDWDFDKRTGERWYEVYWNDKLQFQIDQMVTLKQFKKFMKADSSYVPPFFVASGLPEKQVQKFYDVFFDSEKMDFREIK